MKYIIGSLIISFGIIFVILLILVGIRVKAPANALEYLAAAWILLSVLCYPLARKLIR